MGIIFNNYESAGSGISKTEAKKTGIKLFFEIFLRKFWKLLEVNMLYMLFFLPLMLAWTALIKISNVTAAMIVSAVLVLVFSVLIGPATAGMTKVMRNYVLERHSFIISDFFKAFRLNFKKAAITGFIDCVIALSVFAGLKVYPVLAEQTGTKLMFLPMIISLSFALVVLMMNFYIYLMMVATDLSLKNLIKNSFALAFVAMKESLLTFVIILLISAVAVILPVFVSMTFLFVLPFCPAAFMCYVICFNSYPVIQKYVINPYYTSIGEVNPEIYTDDGEEAIFEDMGGREKPIEKPVEKRKKGKGRRIS